MSRQTRRHRTRAASETGSRRFLSRRATQASLPFSRRLRIEPLEDRWLLANVTVGNTNDVVDGSTASIAALIATPGADGISLREAILAANADAAADTIDFGPSVTGTIQLTNVGHAGELFIANHLTISGPGASLLTVRAFDPSATLGDGARIFNIVNPFFQTSTVAISGLTLTGGDVNGNGGAIYNVENLTVTNCTISGNSVGTTTIGNSGGGIANRSGGNLTVIASTISGNASKGHGGGIYSYLGSLTIAQSTISGNAAGLSDGRGGGIRSRSSTTTIDSSTISGNCAFGGGGIWQDYAGINITNSTISGNSARSIGGGVVALSGPTVRHSTITGNRSDSDNSGGETGGGVFVNFGQFDHTIVAGNLRSTSTRDDISGTLAARYSLIGDNTGATITDNGGNQIGTGASPINALLGPLANNAGPTFTHALLAGSSAIDTGDPAAVAGVGNVPLSDQRGGQFTRVSGGRIDLGAFERQAFVVDTLADENDGNYSAGDFSLREAIGLVNAGSVGADTITFAASLTSGGPATILLTQGELAIVQSLTINGPGASLLTIDASGNDPTPTVNNADGSRVFNLDDGNPNIDKSVALNGLTLTGGDINAVGGAIRSREILTLTASTISGNSALTGNIFLGGGGIYSRGTPTTYNSLTITNSTISGNFAFGGGGGIDANYSALFVIGSTISGNTVAGHGGGIFSLNGYLSVTSSTIGGNTAGSSGGGIFAFGGLLTVTSSTISGNTASSDGGGIYNHTDYLYLLRVTSSTISGNSAGRFGGGISGNASVVNSTISGNEADFGGGIAGSGNVTDSTISGNRANHSGGGVYGPFALVRSTITDNRADADNNGTGSGGGLADVPSISNTILAGNFRSVSTSDDVSGTVTAEFSLIGVDTGATITSTGGTLIGTSTTPIDPRLAPLADNGGPTMTHALLGGSPAIDAGDPAAMAGVGGVPAFDQRGSPFGRVNDGDGTGGARIDIGAFESPPPPPLPADYNRNGVVDAADYVVWRKMLGTSGLLPFAGADGDGDGMVDPDDHSVWTAHFGETLPPGAGSGSEMAELHVQLAVSEKLPHVAASLRDADSRVEAQALSVRPEVRGQETRAQPAASELRSAEFGLRIAESRESRVKGREPERAVTDTGRWRDEALVAWLSSRAVDASKIDREEFDDQYDSEASVEADSDVSEDSLDAVFASLTG